LGLLFWRDYLTGRRFFLAQSYFEFALKLFFDPLRRSVTLFSPVSSIRTAHFFIVLNNSSKIRYCLT
jgi:hypothetical protein